MKRINLIFGFFVATLLFNVSCNKVADISTLLGKMSATIDGAAWSVSATDVSSGLSGVAALKSDEKFLVTGIDADGKTVAVFIGGKETNKDYSLAPIDGDAVSLYKISSDADSSSTYMSVSGTVRLTEFTDKRISGTFSFTAKNTSNETVNITAGSFENVLYTSVDSLKNK